MPCAAVRSEEVDQGHLVLREELLEIVGAQLLAQLAVGLVRGKGRGKGKGRVGAAGAQPGVGLAARQRNIGDFGQASRPHRGLSSGPERLNGSSRARSAAGSLESQPREARIASCGATEAPL